MALWPISPRDSPGRSPDSVDTLSKLVNRDKQRTYTDSGGIESHRCSSLSDLDGLEQAILLVTARILHGADGPSTIRRDLVSRDASISIHGIRYLKRPAYLV